MSIKARRDVARVKGLRMVDHRILAVLAEWCDAEGRCWPSHHSIALDAGADCSPAAVSKSLKRLEAAGLLSIEPRRRSDGTTTTPIYTVLPHGVPEAAGNLTPPPASPLGGPAAGQA